MVKKSLFLALALVAISSTAWAQTRFQVSATFGYTASDGVSGQNFLAPDGNTYNRVDPNNGANFGFQVGFNVNPNAELGFMYRHQWSKLNISGPGVSTDLGDLGIDGYHGYFAYYFGDPEAKLNPYVLAGFGATHVGSVDYVTPLKSGSTASGTEFSTTWGAGVRFTVAQHFGVKGGISWTPTYVKSDYAGWWCDPWWGCYVVGNAQYMNQFHFEAGITIRY
jgi:hypothetical protein